MGMDKLGVDDQVGRHVMGESGGDGVYVAWASVSVWMDYLRQRVFNIELAKVATAAVSVLPNGVTDASVRENGLRL